jgi:hypothetical protein
LCLTAGPVQAGFQTALSRAQHFNVTVVLLSGDNRSIFATLEILDFGPESGDRSDKGVKAFGNRFRGLVGRVVVEGCHLRKWKAQKSGAFFKERTVVEKDGIS